MITLVVSRNEIIRRIVEHSRLAEWNGSWALQYDPATGQHDWCWIGRFPPIGSNADQEPRRDWRVIVLPRINATKLMVDARKDRIEDWVWQASAEGTFDGWLDAGEATALGVKFKFV